MIQRFPTTKHLNIWKTRKQVSPAYKHDKVTLKTSPETNANILKV